MAQPDEQMRVVEEWLQLPESRRRHATDIVAFAYRLLRERPDLFSFARATGDPVGTDPATGDAQARLQKIVNWLQPYLNNREPG